VTVPVPPDRLPPPGTAEIAEYGGHVVWVDQLRDDTGKQVRVVLENHSGRTTLLPIEPARELDLGPGPDGAPTAVYVRCTPGCTIWRYSLTTRRERATTPGRRPTIWGDRIAYVRGRDVRLRTGSHPARVLALRLTDPDDLELGPKQLAYTALADTGEGNGALQLRLHGLSSGRDQLLDSGVIGEGDSTGFNGLLFQSNGIYWQRAHRSACTVRITTIGFYDVRRARKRIIDRPFGPVSVRRAPAAAPETPESEGCGQDG
jgi:hypothetical protein